MPVNPLLGPAYHFNNDTGQFVHGHHERVAHFIKDYDPEMELGWVPPDKRDPGEAKPFCLIHNHPDGSRQAVAFFGEAECNIETIGVWLMENDFRRNNPDAIFNRIQASKLAAELADAKETEEIANEKWEWAKSVLKSPLHTYRHEGKVYRS